MKRIIDAVKRFFHFLRHRRPTVIRSIRFKDRFENVVSVELGTPQSFSEDEKAEQFPIESIQTNGGSIAVAAGKYINHFEAAEICNILFEDVDEKEWCRQRLIKVLEQAKQLELMSPTDVNFHIKNLKGK